MGKRESEFNSNSSKRAFESILQNAEFLRNEIQRTLRLVTPLPFLRVISFLATDEGIEEGIDLEEEVKRIEVQLIKRALTFAGGRQNKAAKLLKLNHTTLNCKIKRYGINYRESVLESKNESSIKAVK